MDGSSQRVQAADQGGRGRVQEFVGNAIDTSMLSGVKCAPSALANDFFQRHPVAGSAPGGNENVGISSKHILRRGLIAGCGDEFSTNCLNEFRNPGLGSNQWLSPFFAKNAASRQSLSLAADALDLALHALDDLLSTICQSNDRGNGHDVDVDVGECPWR